ncbi:MAG: baseplate J/gp47 family protein [Chloroflexota bacterium]
MAAIVYLDVDDEITSAAARIRSGTEGRVALVVPPGSRLATSRINFRLLAREAQTRDRRLSIVAGDAGTRALAASAGLPVFGSVAEYEDALDTPPPTPSGPPPKPSRKARREAARAASPAMAAAAAAAETVPVPPPSTAVIDTDGAPKDLEATQVLAIPVATPVPAPTRPIPVAARRRLLPLEGLPALAGTNALIAAGVLGLAVVVVAIGAWLLLPSASIVVTAQEEAIGPVNLVIRADPTVDAPDAEARIVPAERLTFDLSATDTFTATDKRVEQTAASGSVMFRSYNPISTNTIPRGSVVSTEGGVRFTTRAVITLARARIVFPGTVLPSSANVAIDAVQPGPGGNVPANAITVVPPAENPEVTTVTNPQPTEGGTRAEFPRVAQADFNAAVEQLTLQLGTDFEAILADPSRTPAGLTLFPGTRSIAEPVPSVEPVTLVGQEVASFDLTMTSSGTVIAVDTTPLQTIAESRIRDRVVAEHRIVESSIQVDPDEAIVQGESVSFPVTVRATQVRLLDAKALREQIKGKPVDEARSILRQYGLVTLSVWPDWVATIPTIDARLELRVGPEAPSPEPGSPSGSVAP